MTAFRVSRLALRTGSDQVFILYRRTKEEMPASKEEVRHLEDDGWLTGLECVRMGLGGAGRFCRDVCRPGCKYDYRPNTSCRKPCWSGRPLL